MSAIVFKYREADSTSFVLKCIYQERRSENLRSIQLLQYTFVYYLAERLRNLFRTSNA